MEKVKAIYLDTSADTMKDLDGKFLIFELENGEKWSLNTCQENCVYPLSKVQE